MSRRNSSSSLQRSSPESPIARRLETLRQQVEEYSSAARAVAAFIEKLDKSKKFDVDNPESTVASLVERTNSLSKSLHREVKELSRLSRRSSHNDDGENHGAMTDHEVVVLQKLRKDFTKVDSRAKDLVVSSKRALQTYEQKAIQRTRRRNKRNLRRRGESARSYVAADLDSTESSDDEDGTKYESMRLLQEVSHVNSDLKLEEDILERRHSSIRNLYGQMVQIQDTVSELNTLIVEQGEDVDVIHDNMTTTEHNAEQAYLNVVEASKTHRGKRKWLICWLLCAAIFLTILIVLFVMFGPFANATHDEVKRLTQQHATVRVSSPESHAHPQPQPNLQQHHHHHPHFFHLHSHHFNPMSTVH